VVSLPGPVRIKKSQKFFELFRNFAVCLYGTWLALPPRHHSPLVVVAPGPISPGFFCLLQWGRAAIRPQCLPQCLALVTSAVSRPGDLGSGLLTCVAAVERKPGARGAPPARIEVSSLRKPLQSLCQHPQPIALPTRHRAVARSSSRPPFLTRTDRFTSATWSSTSRRTSGSGRCECTGMRSTTWVPTTPTAPQSCCARRPKASRPGS
jgi:hypothetical protein